MHVYATNDTVHNADELARRYDERAGIEPVFAENLKGGFGIGKVSTECFDANEASVPAQGARLQHRCTPLGTGAPSDLRAVAALSGFAASASRSQGDSCAPEGRWELRLAPRPMLN